MRKQQPPVFYFLFLFFPVLFLQIKMQHNLLQVPFQHDLDLLFRMNWFYQNRMDPGAPGSKYISKKLVSHK